MKNPLRYLFFALMVGGTYAQNNFPPCNPNIGWPLWDKCVTTGYAQWPNIYVGEYRDGKQEGKGTLTFPDGSKYVGEFKDNSRNGEGILYAPNGSIISKGIWVWNTFSGEGQVQRNTGGELAETNLPNCPPSGRFDNCFGTEVYGSGNKFIGEFKDGNFSGKGTLYAPNGSVLKAGIWLDGELINPIQVQKANSPKSEVEKLRAEADEAKRKQSELEAQLKLAQQPVTQQSSPSNIAPRNSKRIALVIGNAAYNSAPLKNPLNDAADISLALRQSGFEVIDQRNATLQEMTRGIREFGDKLLKSDVGLVYYSGHGLEVKGRNYLLPVNASMIREDEIAFQAIDANLILEKMNTAKKSVNILIVDACRDNPFARSFRSTNRGLAQMDAPTGTIVSFSTAPGKTASDGDGRNSPFTKNLVKAMMRADMPIEAMFKEVRKSVVEETKGQQTPWESSSLIGDFYFKASK